jgi:lipopolysaccharide/colanic/teichoic acid biosynthesis glycosyltransferase
VQSDELATGTPEQLARVADVSSDSSSPLNENAFRELIGRERKRSERSRRPFLLMLVQIGEPLSAQNRRRRLHILWMALYRSLRDTDTGGWHKSGDVLGVLFTEINTAEKATLLHAISSRVKQALPNNIRGEQYKNLKLSFHVYPEDWREEVDFGPSDPALYPDLTRQAQSKKFRLLVKRWIDVLGSLLGLVALFPLLLFIATAVRLSSPGPILFRQRRVGQLGRPFEMLKFRSMHVENDCSIHREYVTQFVAGKAEKQPTNGDEGAYKLTSDPRVTSVGAFLRKLSLDELPQFVNVLNGEMSLVGPRPPLVYEVTAYDIWHRKRLMETKPGITGLWQVKGRNRVKFDDMVRMDFAYARSWSLWLDLKILLRTPFAVAEGSH